MPGGWQLGREIRRLFWLPSMAQLDKQPPMTKTSGHTATTSIEPLNGRVLVFIPTFNDRDLLHELASEVKTIADHVTTLIIDDGSSPAIERPSLPDDCLLFRLPSNVGLGVCSHIAFDHALSHGYDCVVRLDADGQHPISQVSALLEPLQRGEADIVVAMRTNHSSHDRPDAVLRRMVKCYFSLLSRIITSGAAPKDVSSGFFVANRRALEALNATTLERYPEPQLYSHACRSGLLIREIRIEQEKRQHGTSTITYVRAIAMIYRFTVYAVAEVLRIRK